MLKCKTTRLSDSRLPPFFTKLTFQVIRNTLLATRGHVNGIACFSQLGPDKLGDPLYVSSCKDSHIDVFVRSVTIGITIRDGTFGRGFEAIRRENPSKDQQGAGRFVPGPASFGRQTERIPKEGALLSEIHCNGRFPCIRVYVTSLEGVRSVQ